MPDSERWYGNVGSRMIAHMRSPGWQPGDGTQGLRGRLGDVAYSERGGQAAATARQTATKSARQRSRPAERHERRRAVCVTCGKPVHKRTSLCMACYRAAHKAQMTCIVCGKPRSGSNRMCGSCRYKLSRRKMCPHCGVLIAETSVMCRQAFKDKWQPT